MKKSKLLSLAVASLLLGGCYSVHYSKVDSLFGSSSDMQSLAVNTQPAAAQCNVTSYKDGSTQTTVSITSPATVDIYQSMKPVTVSCSKTGYMSAQTVIQPQSDGTFATTVSVLLMPASGS